MRWHDQLETRHREGQLPGLHDAVTRTFDAPEALGAQFHEIHAKSVLNRVPGASRMPFGWTVNTYRGCLHRCKYCFARPTHEYLDLNAAEDFDRQIIVKVNAPEVLRAQLRRPSWTFEHIALGTNTDPYQWVEKRYRLTRAVLEVLLEARNPCSVLTKSPLLLRDLDVFQELRAVTEFSACLSIPTLDEQAWRSTEPGTPHPRKRLEAVARLNAAGIPTGVLVAPLMPGINDAEEQVAQVVDACREAGATRVGGQALFLRGATKDVFMGYLRAQRPDLVPMYERLYGTGRGAYLPSEVKQRVEAPLRARARSYRPELAPRFQRDAGDGAAPGGGPPPNDAAERRFRGYAIAHDARRARTAIRDAVDEREPRQPPARQEALF
jgi:DNA repair photolyase